MNHIVLESQDEAVQRFFLSQPVDSRGMDGCEDRTALRADRPKELLDRLAHRTSGLQLGALGANGHVVDAGSRVANSIPASSRI